MKKYIDKFLLGIRPFINFIGHMLIINSLPNFLNETFNTDVFKGSQIIFLIIYIPVAMYVLYIEDQYKDKRE